MEQWWQVIFIPALGYLFIQGAQHSKQLAVLQNQMHGLNNKIDLFLKTETDLLKDLLKETKDAISKK